ncbi:MAG: DUF2336 domain-containing protein [Rhizomicrobium sp.]
MSEAEPVLVALVRNATARISALAYETLVEKSAPHRQPQEPLTGRPDLPPVLATRMCEWVSDALKTYIARNYAIAPEKLSAAIVQAATVLSNEPAATKSPPAESAQKLIEKLGAGRTAQSRIPAPVLHQGQLDLFDLALAKLVGLPLPELRLKFYNGGPRAGRAGLPRRRHRPLRLQHGLQSRPSGARPAHRAHRRRHGGRSSACSRRCRKRAHSASLRASNSTSVVNRKFIPFCHPPRMRRTQVKSCTNGADVTWVARFRGP